MISLPNETGTHFDTITQLRVNIESVWRIVT